MKIPVATLVSGATKEQRLACCRFLDNTKNCHAKISRLIVKQKVETSTTKQTAIASHAEQAMILWQFHQDLKLMQNFRHAMQEKQQIHPL